MSERFKITPPEPPVLYAGMPYTGIATFARAPLAGGQAAVAGPGSDVARPNPLVADLTRLGADFAVFGVPFDCAIGYRPGPRLAPRAIRDMSTRLALAWGPENPGYWEVSEDRWYLRGARLADVGDADPLYFDLEHLDRSVEYLVGSILAAGAVPVGLGGDHSVTFPIIRGLTPLFAPGGPHEGKRVHIIQIDAHLDYLDSVSGFTRSNSNPIRRAAELPFVGDVTVLGIRGLRTNPAAYQAGLERGHRVVLMQEIRQQGLEVALKALPEGELVYLTLDVDGLDPAVCPGTSSPEPDGFSYAQTREILRVMAERNRVIGMDVVEVNPYLDVTNVTALMAARLALEAMAFIQGQWGADVRPQ